MAQQYASAALRIPKVIEQGEVSDGAFAVSERAFGRPLDALSGPEMRNLLPALLKTLDAIQQFPVPTDGGFGRWDAQQIAPHSTWPAFLLNIRNEGGRIAGWQERLASSRIGMRPFETAYEALTQLVVTLPEVHFLVHADLLNGNVLVADNQVAAVLDWGNSLYGDFVYDLAWFDFWKPWYPAWEDIDFVEEAKRHCEVAGTRDPGLRGTPTDLSPTHRSRRTGLQRLPRPLGRCREDRRPHAGGAMTGRPAHLPHSAPSICAGR